MGLSSRTALLALSLTFPFDHFFFLAIKMVSKRRIYEGGEWSDLFCLELRRLLLPWLLVVMLQGVMGIKRSEKEQSDEQESRVGLTIKPGSYPTIC